MMRHLLRLSMAWGGGGTANQSIDFTEPTRFLILSCFFLLNDGAPTRRVRWTIHAATLTPVAIRRTQGRSSPGHSSDNAATDLALILVFFFYWTTCH